MLLCTVFKNTVVINTCYRPPLNKHQRDFSQQFQGNVFWCQVYTLAEPDLCEVQAQFWIGGGSWGGLFTIMWALPEFQHPQPAINQLSDVHRQRAKADRSGEKERTRCPACHSPGVFSLPCDTVVSENWQQLFRPTCSTHGQCLGWECLPPFWGSALTQVSSWWCQTDKSDMRSLMSCRAIKHALQVLHSTHQSTPVCTHHLWCFFLPSASLQLVWKSSISNCCRLQSPCSRLWLCMIHQRSRLWCKC